MDHGRIQIEERIGDEIDMDEDAENLFTLTFLPLDIFDHWDRCGDIADFMAAYFEYGYDAESSYNIISTVVNELVENAVKYSRNKSSEIFIEGRKRGQAMLIRCTNSLPRNQRGHFAGVGGELFSEDLEELYLKKLVQGTEDRSFSGIGLVLLKKDYDVKLSMEFLSGAEETPGESDLFVRISIELETA